MTESPLFSTLEDLDKRQLVDDSGVTYLAFRSTLRPRWSRVWVDIALGYAALVALMLLLVQLEDGGAAQHVAQALAGAVAIGYAMAYLQLFIHEAAHFNLHPDRSTNDRLANLVIGCWSATDIVSYRRIHWEHHRRLGEPQDTERSYFSSPGLRFALETLLGLRALAVITARRRHLATAAPKAQDSVQPRNLRWPAISASLHLGIVVVASASGHWVAAIAWALGIAMWFPFFGALRQLLEHRSPEADAHTDYSRTPHGRYSRMFREGPLGSTFGAAGFTRHLLHHWDPQVSYTNLADVERFLDRCPATRGISAAKTTYLGALKRLVVS
jgi:fatty acid desaturase